MTVGESPARVGGVERVTGRQQYVADIHLEDVLHVKLVALDVARARIRGIDTSAAMAVPGVRLVMTAADLPDPMPRFGPQLRDRPVLAIGETKFHGDPVAAVAAETLDAAEEAARLVRVDFEELPAVHTVAARPGTGCAARPGPLAPAERPARGHERAPRAPLWVGRRRGRPNARRTSWSRARTPSRWSPSSRSSRTRSWPRRTATGSSVWSAIQHPNWLQRVIADLVRLPLSKVRIIAPDPGGGFGGKQHAKYEPLVAFMALRLGRPVRLVLTLEETFQAVRRGAAEIRVRSGFRRDGTIVFRDIDADYLIGAYADIADRTVAKGSYTSGGPYRCPAVRIVARSVLSHTVPSTAFRGFGNPQQIWATESNMDDAARQLGIDPLELRLRNLARTGDPFIPGDTPADGEWPETLRRAAELIGWGDPPCRPAAAAASPWA